MLGEPGDGAFVPPSRAGETGSPGAASGPSRCAPMADSPPPILRCRGWRQEAILRLLENNLAIAEDPENLVVYAAHAKAARDHESLRGIVAALTDLRDGETLVVQSGKPIAVLPTGPRSPAVLLANGNLVGRWATPEVFYDLERRNLIAWGGLTAGCWQYIGSQGVLQGTYETFAQVAREHFGGSLRGRLIVSAGLGGMGSAQPIAITRMLQRRQPRGRGRPRQGGAPA